MMFPVVLFYGNQITLPLYIYYFFSIWSFGTMFLSKKCKNITKTPANVQYAMALCITSDYDIKL